MPARPKAPAEGSRYELTQAIGQGPGALLPGIVMTVREVVPAKEEGAHDKSDDAVVLTFTEDAPVIVRESPANPDTGELGPISAHEVGRGKAERAVSVGLSDFAQTFKEAK